MSSIQEIADFTIVGTYAGQAAAANTTVQLVGMVSPVKGTVKQVVFVPSASITANGSNFSVLTVQNRTGTLAATTAVASRTWAATNSVAATPETFTLSGTAANLEVGVGDNIQIAQTSGGTGLTIPAGTFLLVVSPHR